MKNEQIKQLETICDQLVAKRMESTGESWEDAARHIAQVLQENYSPNASN